MHNYSLHGLLSPYKQLYHTGLLEVPITQLQQPPRSSRLLRESDPTFIKNLKENMLQDPSGPGASPVAVLCKDVSKVEEFNAKFKSVYRYEVLGGLHSFLAKSELCQELPDNPFFKTVWCEVYVGLSDEQALRLSQRHNRNSHFTHKVTHRDMVSE